MKRFAALGLLLAVVVGVAGSSAADARIPKGKGPALTLVLPQPGDFTAAILDVVRTGKRLRPLKLQSPRVSKLGPGYRLVYAIRRSRKRKRELDHVFLLMLHPAAAYRASPFARAAYDPAVHPIGDWEYESFPDGGFDMAMLFAQVGGLPRVIPASEEDKDRRRRLALGVHEVVNTDRAKPKQLQDLFETLNADGFRPGWGDGKLPSGLDTGHYDDGHAFGWSKNEAKAMSDWQKIGSMPLDDVISQIETDIAADYNGDGVVGPKTSAPGSTTPSPGSTTPPGSSTPPPSTTPPPPDSTGCRGSATTPSFDVPGPPGPSDYGYVYPATTIPASCTIPSGGWSADLIDDSDGTVVACKDGLPGPPPGQVACPSGAYSGTMGSGGDAVLLYTLALKDGAWQFTVSTQDGRPGQIGGTLGSAHIVYIWKGS